jgi:Kef-type K+ transport system membrane component KefB
MISATGAPVAPIGAHSLLVLLLQLGLLLLLATCLGRVATRFHLPAVVGELCVGIILGPTVLAHAAPGVSQWLFPASGEQVHMLDAVGQIGVLLLVGMTGMQMDIGQIRRRGATAAGVSLGGLIVPFGLGIVAGFMIPLGMIPDGANATVFALFLGVAMCVSAIPVIAKTLIDLNLLYRNVGQLILVAGMVDDIFGWVMLSVVSAMAVTVLTTGTVLTSLGYLAAVLLFAATIGRPIVRRILAPVVRTGEPGGIAAATAILVLAAAAGTHSLGLEPVFGAFICGLLIGGAGRVEPASIAPLRTVVLSVLAPIFFATAGLRMDLTVLTRPDVLLVGVAVLAVAIIGKFVGVFAGARLSKLNNWEALALGAGLNSRGVIEVVVAMVGLRLGILSLEIYTIVLLVAIVTSVLAPPVLRFAMRRVKQTKEEDVRCVEHQAWDYPPPVRTTTVSTSSPATRPADPAAGSGSDGDGVEGVAGTGDAGRGEDDPAGAQAAAGQPVEDLRDGPDGGLEAGVVHEDDAARA